MSNLQIFSTPTGKRAIYYHTNWSCYGRNFQVANIHENVTDIAYAFWNINADGTIITGDLGLILINVLLIILVLIHQTPGMIQLQHFLEILVNLKN